MLTDTSVISPYGSSARSWRRPQASRTALYLMRTTRGNPIRDNDRISLMPIVITQAPHLSWSNSLPNRMFSFRDSLRTQACCDT